MSACEHCWTEAQRRAFYRGGFAADHYAKVLAENDNDAAHIEAGIRSDGT